MSRPTWQNRSSPCSRGTGRKNNELRWNADEHPRDEKGRFVSTGGNAAKCRKEFDRKTKKYLNKTLRNKSGKSAVFTKRSMREITSNLKHSIKNGFSVKDHFEIANKIVSTYQSSDFIKRHGDLKNKTDNVFMERFLSKEIKLKSGRSTRACITVKDDTKGFTLFLCSPIGQHIPQGTAVST